jgi:hypothetical protein
LQAYWWKPAYLFGSNMSIDSEQITIYEFLMRSIHGMGPR